MFIFHEGLRPESLNSLLQNADTIHSRQPAPSGVHRRHLHAVHIAQKNGQAVGHHDGACQAARPRAGTVGLRTVGSVRRQFQYLGAMDLVQKHRPDRNGLLQDGAVVLHVHRTITYM